MTTYRKQMKPDFKKALDRANDLLISSNSIESFPFSMKKVIKEKTDAVCRSYNVAGGYGPDMFAFGSKDAILMVLEGRKIIFYNEEIANNARKRFSLGHELGHLKLDHNLNNKNSYDNYEVEANFFTAQLLMPEQIINELIKRQQTINIANLMMWFGVSREAAEKRIKTLRQIDFTHRTYEEYLVDTSIVYKYHHFIDQIAPKSIKHYDVYEDEEMENLRNSWR